jgi:hypothetical protein
LSPEGRTGFWETYRGPASDPRTIVTHAAFSVHPDLLGIPLAQHSRRAVAMGVDLLLIALVTQAGGLLLGILAAVFLFRVTFKRKDQGAPSLMGTAFRGAVGCFGAVVLLITVIVLWSAVSNRVGDGDRRPRAERVAPVGVQTGPVVGWRGLMGGFGEGIRFRQAEGEEEALAAARSLALRGEEMGLAPDEIREVLMELAPGDAPWRGAVAGWDLFSGRAAQASAPPGESAEEEAPAASTDTVGLEEASPVLPPEIADSLRHLEERLEGESRRRARAERAAVEAGRELEEARRVPGVRAFLRRVADDLGLGFGWAALYFTVFTTWWNGRTPGKRLMRLRVVRLSGEPLNWWDSFERYGGYAAGFATGLLGFAQVYWDPNRQAIHDRIGRTVVIQDGKPRVPGFWDLEGAVPRPGKGSHDSAGGGATGPAGREGVKRAPPPGSSVPPSTPNDASSP